MKKLISLSLIVAAGILFSGCVASTPQLPVVSSVPVVTAPGVTNIVTVTNTPPPVYSVSPTLATVQSNLQAYVAAVAPVISELYPPAAPAVPLANNLLTGIFAILSVISTGVAYVKNKSANSQTAAAAALAQHIVNTQPQAVAAALTVAAANNSTAEVAQHLANAQKPV
jgi:hypothetical protein